MTVQSKCPEMKEPEQWVRVVTVRRQPMFLLNAMLNVIPFGWMLMQYKWDAIEGRRFLITLTFERRGPFVQVGWKETYWIRVYNHIGPITLIRLLWLVLWSKPEEKEQDHGVCETGRRDADPLD